MTERAKGVAAPKSVAWFGAATILVWLVLLLVGAVLSVKDGGIEGYLNTADLEAIGKYEQGLGGMRSWIPGLYLGLDSACFVPLYSLFALIVAKGLLGSLSRSRPACVARVGIAGLIVAVVGVDLLENVSGAFRVSLVSGALAAVGLLLAGVVALYLVREPVVRSVYTWAFEANVWLTLMTALGLAVVTLALASWSAFAGAESTETLTVLVAGAHRAKHVLGLITALVLALGCAAWMVGLDPKTLSQKDQAAHDMAQTRAALRVAIGDMLGRSRYVLVALALIGGLTLLMDQARDIAYAMAAPARGDDGWQTALHLSGSLVSFVLLALAAGALDFTCWLWTRSVCQLKPLGLQLQQEAERKRKVARLAKDIRLNVNVEPGMLRRARPAADPLRSIRHAARREGEVAADTFAKYWARALAFVPIAMLVLLYARVIEESVRGAMAQSTSAVVPVLLLFVAGIGTLWFGAWLLHRHSTQSTDGLPGYYSTLTWEAWATQVAFMMPNKEGSNEGTKYRPFVRPHWLPAALLCALVGFRLLDVFPSQWLWSADFLPTMTLSVAFLSVAFWLCFFGWLSILETYQSIPWFVLLALLVIGFGVAGLTDNHRVWLPIVCGESNEGAHLVMLAASALVAIVLFATYFVSLLIVRHWSKINLKPLWLGLGCVLGLIVFLGVEVGVLRLFDTFGTSRRVAAKSTLPTRLTLDGALAAWLTRLYDSERGGVGEVPVYFVSSEGGGIRAAVWTALILEHFAEQERENFIERTFSISGVSGGAVGGAVFRACHLQQATTSRQCIERFAKTDMVSPLISAWMFEDVMARVLPTRWCSTPGCGLLSRGAWFEQAMENAASKLRGGLVATGTDARASRHAPYLLLNSTWIETGERAVASDLIVDWMSFPGAKDQLQILGSDIPLGTAAHNAARFPYTNPIGSLHAPRGNCPMPRKLVDDPGEAAAAADAIVLCGHLGDGGYFDNGGAQSTLDSVRGFAACLGDASDPDAKAYPRCQELSDEIKQWGRARLVPQVLAIRNDPKRGVDCSETCSCPALPGGQATADEYTPEAPECNNPTQALVGALGPGLAVLNVSGIGANGRLAEARQKGAVLALRGRLGNAAASSARPPVRALDLRENGVLYPLGWHLSPLAVEGLTAQAAGLQLAAENADPSAVATPAP